MVVDRLIEILSVIMCVMLLSISTLAFVVHPLSFDLSVCTL